MKFVLFASVAALSLAGCSQADEAPVAPEATTAAAPEAVVPESVDGSAAAVNHDGWVGRWIGVEGMFVDIQPAGDGTFTLEMQSDLDTKGTYTGTSTAEGISFERGGETLVLRQSDGAATGLKWLDGKKDCLTVATGEGYCRD